MKAKRLYAVLSLAAFVVICGCATTKGDAQSEHDGKTARTLIDTMRSPIHSFPANVPR